MSSFSVGKYIGILALVFFVAAVFGAAACLQRMYRWGQLEFAAQQSMAFLRGKSRDIQYRFLLSSLPEVMPVKRRFDDGWGYWPQIYKGYLSSARIDVIRGAFSLAESSVLKAIEYHPYYSSSFTALAAIYAAEGRKERANCCEGVAKDLLDGRWGQQADKFYRCCLS